jgi:integrase/recombinase XerD
VSGPKPERLLADYLAALAVRGLAADTRRGRAQAVRAFLARLGKKDLRAAVRADVEAHAAALLTDGREASTVRAHLAALRGFFAWAETADAVLVNPCVGVALPKLPDRLPRRVLAAAEVARIIAQPDTGTSQGKRDRALLETLYTSGLRRAEAAALGVHDLDLDAGLVRVARGKGGRGRVAPLGASAVAALRAYLDARRVWLEAVGRSESALWLSPIKPHGPLKKEAVALVVRRCAARAGAGRVGAHAWRHTCATHLLRGGASLAYVQRLLGHRSLKTTQIYTRVEVAEVRAMVQASHPRR